MKYYFTIAALISLAGAGILIGTNGNSWTGATLMIAPWLLMPIVTYISRKLK